MNTTPPRPVSEQTVHIKVSTLVAVIILLVNVVVLGPGSWLVSSWRDRYETKLDTLGKEVKGQGDQLIDIRAMIYIGYLAKDTYRAEKEYTETRIHALQEQINALSIAEKNNRQ